MRPVTDRCVGLRSAAAGRGRPRGARRDRRRPARPAPAPAAPARPTPRPAPPAAPAPTASRSTASSLPRTCRSVPAYVWPRRGGPSCAGLPASRQAHCAAIGQRAQSSFLAVHTSAPSSIEAAAQRAARRLVLGQQGAGELALGGGGGVRRVLDAGRGAGEDPADVGVEDGMPLPVREGGHRRRRVLADPGQREQLRVLAAVRRRRAAPLWPARRRAAAARGAGSRAGPRRGRPRRAPRRPGRRGAASGPATARTPAAPG